MSDTKCQCVGICRLPHGHSGLCVYLPAPPRPAGVAQIGEKDGAVIVDFGVTGAWQWVTFTPAQAIAVGATLIRRGQALQLAARPAQGEEVH